MPTSIYADGIYADGIYGKNADECKIPPVVFTDYKNQVHIKTIYSGIITIETIQRMMNHQLKIKKSKNFVTPNRFAALRSDDSSDNVFNTSTNSATAREEIPGPAKQNIEQPTLDKQDVTPTAPTPSPIYISNILHFFVFTNELTRLTSPNTFTLLARVDVLPFINRVSNDERVEGLLRILSISGFELIYLSWRFYENLLVFGKIVFFVIPLYAILMFQRQHLKNISRSLKNLISINQSIDDGIIFSLMFTMIYLRFHYGILTQVKILRFNYCKSAVSIKTNIVVQVMRDETESIPIKFADDTVNKSADVEKSRISDRDIKNMDTLKKKHSELDDDSEKDEPPSIHIL
ncbi:hypothetical protein ACI65C_000106 [Semiaphis heraclei]